MPLRCYLSEILWLLNKCMLLEWLISSIPSFSMTKLNVMTPILAYFDIFSSEGKIIEKTFSDHIVFFLKKQELYLSE